MQNVDKKQPASAKATGRQGIKNQKFSAIFIASILIFVLFVFPAFSLAQNLDPQVSNPNSSKFRLAICDGPEQLNQAKTHMIPDGRGGLKLDPPNWKPDPNFIPCNFKGVIIQAQHLINTMIVLGVFAAIIGFTYAGYLYITGVPGNINKAKDIFRKVAIGFIIMLIAWFMVYQILDWLTGNPGLKALLGTP